MIRPAPHTQRVHVPPGSLFTGLREYACDGAVLEVKVAGTVSQPRVITCRVVELHDVNVGQRRTRHDVGAFLRRCLERIKEDGLVVVLGEQVISVPAARIEVDKIRFQQFCSRSEAEGPFSSAEELI